MVYAQELKPEVALKITQTKLQIAQLQKAEAQLINQYSAYQAQETQLNSTLLTETQSALKDSDLDPTKFTLNPDTLAVIKNPEPAKPAADATTPTK
jgi:hypothetical protein